MKNTLFTSAVLCIIFFTATLSCKKSSNNTATTSTTSLNQLFAGLRTTPQSITVAAGRDTMILGDSGTLLHFYANSFKDASGNIITSGTINVQLVEMYKPGAMIANRSTTLSAGQLLLSGGEINISATMNGQAVYANKYGVGFMQTSPSAQPMTLFYGNTGNGDSVVNWVVADTAKEANIARFSEDDVYGRPWVGYVFDSSSSLAYTNCDAFYNNDSPKTSVTVVMPDSSFNPTNTSVYLVLPSINCVMSTVEPYLGGVGWNAATHSINLLSENQSSIVPIGMAYKIVVIANKNGSYYYCEVSGTTSMGMSVNAVLAADNIADIQTRLAAL